MSVSIDRALALIADLPLTIPTQTISIEEALGRIAACDIDATYRLPRFDNSAMDGYAVRTADAGKRITVTAKLLAGHPADMTVRDGEAVKIMTGALIPEGTQAVVPVEHVAEATDNAITLPDTIKTGANIRRAGEDIAAGRPVVTKGELITAGHVALLATQGITHLTVHARPRVTVFGTGEELAPHYARIEAHQIYNSNSPMLSAFAAEGGADVSFVEASGDNLASIKDNIANALGSDLLITSGGASVGDADLTKKALKAMGMEEIFTKIDIKPGKPTSLGRIGRTLVLILPGNPLACAVNMMIFGTTLIRRLRGDARPFPTPIPVPAACDIPLKGGVDTVVLGALTLEGFIPLAPQGPNMVSPLARVDGWIIADRDTAPLTRGALVRVIALRERGGQERPVSLTTR